MSFVIILPSHTPDQPKQLNAKSLNYCKSKSKNSTIIDLPKFYLARILHYTVHCTYIYVTLGCRGYSNCEMFFVMVNTLLNARVIINIFTLVVCLKFQCSDDSLIAILSRRKHFVTSSQASCFLRKHQLIQLQSVHIQLDHVIHYTVRNWI